jgi:hypothetical protein
MMMPEKMRKSIATQKLVLTRAFTPCKSKRLAYPLGWLITGWVYAAIPILGGCEQALPTSVSQTGPAEAGISPNSPASSAPPTRLLAQQPSDPPADEQLRKILDDTIDFIEHQRELTLEKNAAWQIMHGVLAFGRDFQVRHGDLQVNTLDWVLAGQPMKGWTLRKGNAGLRAEIEPGKQGQGHEDQWLAVVSQSGIPHTHPLQVNGQQYQIYDILTQAMHDTYEGKECSWSLIGLSQYLQPIDQSWEAADGARWSVERILTMEGGTVHDEYDGQERINEGACGGTHRLIGMAMAVQRYQQQYPDRELSGGWEAATERIDWAVEAARTNQLPNGAFSIRYFERPARSRSVGENLGATGHTLEFLATALQRQQLSEPWVRRAATYLCQLLADTEGLNLECGALYHAAHGLVLYRERCFGDL